MMKWLVNSGWWLGNRHSPLRRGISFVFSLSSLVLITACTDYVSQIEDRYGEWNVGQVYVPAEESSSSVAFPMSSWSGGGAGAIGSITDSRDGQSYKTVVIGTQTWMAQNLNYETANSYCYGDSPSNCTKYGRFYTWAAAMDSVGMWSTNGKGCGYNKTCSPTYPVRGVCPEGWHLPTQTEWNTLFTAVGGQSTAGNMLKSTNGWYSSGNGTDAYSFSALPAGIRHVNGDYSNEGYDAYFWSSSENDFSNAYSMYFSYLNVTALPGSYNKILGYSVRCVKDEKFSPSATKVKSSSSKKMEQSSSSVIPSSSSLTPSSSSVAQSVVDPSAVVVGSITDSRDGQSYKTVSIGSQTWMAENLNYKTADSYCYSDNASNCTKYGRFYTWAAAMDSVGMWSTNGKGCGYNKTCSPTYPVRGVCPEGWHLPTQTEWNTLFAAVGGQSTAGKILKSTSGWNSSGNGTDAYSFSALSAGNRYNDGGYYGEGDLAYFWSSTESNNDNADDMYLTYHNDGIAYLGYDYKDDGFSVRCVKD